MASRTNPLPHEKLTFLGIEVTAFVQAGVYQTSARVSCRKENCGREIELVRQNKEASLHAECPIHGVLAVFNNFDDYAEALKTAINQSNDAMGLTRIDSGAKGMFERYN